MDASKLYEKESPVYPGGFVPISSEEKVREEILHAQKENANQPQVNMTELADTFRVEMIIPGIRREELGVIADKNVLSVSVVHLEKEEGKPENTPLHEFECSKCFCRNIFLPDTAETELASAEYKNGVLSIFIPKAAHSVINPHTRIVVY